MTLELIIWNDAHSLDSWCEVKDLSMEPKRIVTLGLIIKETEEAVAVSAGYCHEDPAVSVTMIVPKSMIVHRQLIVGAEVVAGWLSTSAGTA